MDNKLFNLMHPNAVAIIGASTKPGSVGNELILRATEAKFEGKLVAINPKAEEICGVPCYPNISAVPFRIDTAIVAVPAQGVLNVLAECNNAGCKNAVIISSGFKEVGEEGKALEEKIKDFANTNDMTIVGPNCLGIINTDPKYSLNACFAPLQPIAGTIGFATQSGALASGIINILPNLKIGISQMISLGNQACINSIDVLRAWENDDSVKQILMYLESIPQEKEFREVASRISLNKPIMIIKSGRSEQGAKASVSHTGSLAGDDSTVNGLLASSGVIREIDLRDLFSTAQVLSKCPIPKGENMAIITNAGGPGIMAADSASDFGIPLATLTESTKKKLRAVLSPQASVNNPVDVIASATAEQYEKSAEILLNAKEVDILFVIYLYITGKNDIRIMQALEQLKKSNPNKPIVAMLLTTTDFNKELSTCLPCCSIPTFDFIADAMQALSRLLMRKRYLEAKSMERRVNLDCNKDATAKILAEAKAQGITQLTTVQSLQIFSNYHLPVPKWGNAQSLMDAKKIAAEIGYPVVLKMSSKTVTHKSDIGGVVTNIKSEEELVERWNRLMDRLREANLIQTLDGIVVMQQIKGASRELVAGIVKKAGTHQMMFGLGGIFVEALKEVAFRPCPLSSLDAVELINSTKAKNILGALRGTQAADKEILANCLLALSQLVTDFPEINEIDANPLMIDDKGTIFVVDARIVL